MLQPSLPMGRSIGACGLMIMRMHHDGVIRFFILTSLPVWEMMNALYQRIASCFKIFPILSTE